MPVITSLLTVAGFAAPHKRYSLSVGVVVDRAWVAWGVCTPLPTDEWTMAEAQTTVKAVISPALQGRPLASFGELAVLLDGLTEDVMVTRPSKDGVASGMSRRDVLYGRFSATDKGTRTETVTETRPIAASIRYGVSQALLTAVARARNVGVADLLRQEYGLVKATKLLPIIVRLDVQGEVAAARLPIDQLGGVSYQIGAQAAAVLGESGEMLQRFVRQIKVWLMAIAADPTSFVVHLDVGGGLGRLFDNDLGKLLGALYGLEQAAKPFTLYIEEPFVLAERHEQLQEIKVLRSYMSRRQLVAQLVTRVTGGDETAVDGGPDTWHFHLPQLGSLHQSMQMVATAQVQEVPFLLSSHDNDTQLAQLAYVGQSKALLLPLPNLAGVGTALRQLEADIR